MINQDDINILSRESIVNPGGVYRIKKAMIKAMERKPLTVGFIGGSITEGAGAASYGKSYASLVLRWWKEKFPETEINYINAGIGATGSILGVHRVKKDLLDFEPDFVIIEYAVNDASDDINTGLCFEGLVRRVLKSANEPGIMLLFMTGKDGENAQRVQERIGFHYNLPMVSYKNGIWPYIRNGRIKWDEIGSDMVHPNDYGHFLASRFITDRLNDIFNEPGEYPNINVMDKINKPLWSDLYESASIAGGNDIKPVTYGGWAKGNTYIFTPGWVACGKNNPVVFKVRAVSIGVIYKKYNSGKMGRAKVRVDDMEYAVLEGHFPCDWGGYAAAQIIAGNLEDRVHTVEVTYIEDAHQESSGSEFMLCGLLVS